MCQHVFLEVAIFCAFVFTLIAAERFFSDMNKNVLFQMNRIGGRVGTHWASVGFLSSRICFGFGCIIQLKYKSQESPKGSDSRKSESELKYLRVTRSKISFQQVKIASADIT